MMELQPVSLSRIFCPIDFSPGSADALRMALALGRVCRAEVFVCYCLERSNFREAATDRILQRLDDMALGSLLFEPSPTPKWRLLVLEGEVQTAVPRAAATYGADLIVTCPHKPAHPPDWRNSSVRAISLNAPCPVLVMRNPPAPGNGVTANGTKLEKIMVACAFSNEAHLVLAHGLSLARKFQAQLHILFVLPKALRLKLGVNLQAAFTPMDRRGTLPEWFAHLVPPEVLNQSRFSLMRLEGQTLRDIFWYATERQTDLLCLGMDGIECEMNPLCGSNNESLLNHAAFPVLLVRPLNPFGGEKHPAGGEAEPVLKTGVFI